jgi:hypothetical protein
MKRSGHGERRKPDEGEEAIAQQRLDYHFLRIILISRAHIM